MTATLTAPAPPPEPPELPPRARPRWPGWMGFAAMGTGLAVASLAVVPLVPVVLLLTEGGAIGALALLTLLRTHLPVWLAVLINGSVFGLLHFQGIESLSILPVIAVFGFGVCLVYEATGSVLAVIAIHAAFNTLATTDPDTTATLVLPLAVGVALLASCVLAALRLGPAPSPFPPVRT